MGCTLMWFVYCLERSINVDPIPLPMDHVDHSQHPSRSDDKQTNVERHCCEKNLRRHRYVLEIRFKIISHPQRSKRRQKFVLPIFL